MHNTSGVTGRKSADTFYFTDGIVYTYCGMAPGFDLKAKLSLSESVELAPEWKKKITNM